MSSTTSLAKQSVSFLRRDGGGGRGAGREQSLGEEAFRVAAEAEQGAAATGRGARRCKREEEMARGDGGAPRRRAGAGAGAEPAGGGPRSALRCWEGGSRAGDGGRSREFRASEGAGLRGRF